MKRLKLPAQLSQLDRAVNFVNDELEKYGCPAKIVAQIDVAVEEIFVNIANYAYHPVVGDAEIECRVGGEPLRVTIQFLDHGKPYDPLLHGDPDITLPADERQIGGLGILMVKKSMDEVRYQYKDGKNILTIAKNIYK